MSMLIKKEHVGRFLPNTKETACIVVASKVFNYIIFLLPFLISGVLKKSFLDFAKTIDSYVKNSAKGDRKDFKSLTINIQFLSKFQLNRIEIKNG